MKILLLHNRYQQAGGEDAVVAAERRLLADAGHDVVLLEPSNDSIRGLGRTVAAGLGAIYSLSARRRVARAIAEVAPDVVHVHNHFPLLSPSVFDACRDAGVPVVQTLHNYRSVCPNALLFRDGHTCHDCVDRLTAWPAVWHGCYRNSRVASVAVAAMTTLHRHRGTLGQVDATIALSEFQRRLVTRAGIPADRIAVKPNGVADPGFDPGRGPGDYALYAGRLAPEKGLGHVVEAYDARGPSVPLVVLGDGPLRAELEQAVIARGAADRVTFLGRRDRGEVQRWMQGARFLVFPTDCYEGLPLAPIEAAACGRPSLASDLGAVPEIVTHDATGWLVPPGDPAAWRRALEAAWSSPAHALDLGTAARARYEARFTEARSLAGLLSIYRRVITAAPPHPLRPLRTGVELR
jgi:glycosyltransferase involved in cell wall biosynthesis